MVKTINFLKQIARFLRVKEQITHVTLFKEQQERFTLVTLLYCKERREQFGHCRSFVKSDKSMVALF